MGNFFARYKLYTKVIILAVALGTVAFVADFPGFINQKVENGFHSLYGQKMPDSSIVIIEINQNDIDKLGPWPLKRSYYALLINKLTSLGVKEIGLEVFLSEKLASQAVYNDLLNNEIDRSGRVVLASVAEDFPDKQGPGSLMLPEPKKSLPGLATGHVNYIDNYGIYIPLRITPDGTIEKAFALVLAQKNGLKESLRDRIKLNIFSSWKNFRNYTLLQFFALLENDSPELKYFRNKTVIIGVSHPQISQVISTNFDKEMPGLALHAFALDNLLNNRMINTKYDLFSSIFFAALLLGLIFVRVKTEPFYRYLILFLAFALFSFLLFNLFNTELNYASFLVPFFFLTLFEFYLSVLQRRTYLNGVLTETGKLKQLLEKKESELRHLQKELDMHGEQSEQNIIEKITELKNEIGDLRQKQNDTVSGPSALEESKAENFYGIIYKSRVMASVVDLIKKVAPEEATVLILGESGTGKELAARAIHELNWRRGNSFVAVNCAALSETLLESELFGHVKGAFTNAISDKTGRFEAADKGTIFLDEIGETSENFQVKLLRVLQTGEFEKVGSSKTQKADVRVIAATNRELERLVKEGKFREDLYYRLNVITVKLPPLKERREDIALIAGYLLNSGNEKMELSLAALEQLNKYEWKGNVRELESVLKRAVIFARAAGRKIVKLSDLPNEIVGKDRAGMETLILESLREKKFSHSSINETASELGDVSRTIISENFRGMLLRAYYNAGYDVEKAAANISGTDDVQVIEKVKSKLLTFLKNIEVDVNPLKVQGFEVVKNRLSSKYKNLPQKYHFYLDEIIKKILGTGTL
ncbi:MAG: sigma 54-interacting transcriptional regulator [Ignavibacteriales bacterium]